MQPPLRIHASTHEGLVHEKNEDSHAVVNTDEGGVLLLICDGMGGMGRGELASAMAVEHISRLVREGRGFPPERLRRAIREADTVVRNELCGDGRGMPGATAVMVYVLDGMGHVAWAGDSRAYLVRAGRVVERTNDHKLVNELVAAGQLTEEEARGSALAHVVTRALGGRPPSDRPVKASTLGHPWKLAQGDTVLLCSDGVCDLILDDEIPAMLAEVPPEVGARNLVQAALERGGHDNITCIVASWEGGDYVEDERATPSFSMRDHAPDLDVRDTAALTDPDDDGRGVTEEIDPTWQPGDGDGSLEELRRRTRPAPSAHNDLDPDAPELPVASNPDERTLEPPPVPVAGRSLKGQSPSPMIVVALGLVVLVVVGLALALWS